jgi:5'-3' exonuclease
VVIGKPERQCLVDGDILQYEIGFAAEANWKHKHPEAPLEWLIDNPPPFDVAEEQLLYKIKHIEEQCEATEPSIFFFTGKENFRFEIAKTVPYKSGRSQKPYHYKNIGAYLTGLYPYKVQHNLEADDLLCIEQRTSDGRTIICSRDKDLRAVVGWHYGWELGNQPQFGPFEVSDFGFIRLSENRKKLSGWGLKWFLAQCLMGDPTDSIPGIPKFGVVSAWEVLDGVGNYEDGLLAVKKVYQDRMGDKAAEYLAEQGQLLWMTRELFEDQPILWNPEEIYEV